jgi:hypothetical protein
MAGNTPRSARVPHTEKRLERCPPLRQHRDLTKGNTPEEDRDYPALALHLVQARLLANAGGVAQQYLSRCVSYSTRSRSTTWAIRLRQRLRRSAPGTATASAGSTVATWLHEHRPLTTYARLRAKGRRHFSPTQAIRSIKLYHRQIYKFAYHRPKLAMMRDGKEYRRFAGVALRQYEAAHRRRRRTSSGRNSELAPNWHPPVAAPIWHPRSSPRRSPARPRRPSSSAHAQRRQG